MESNCLRISSSSSQEELRIINKPNMKPKPKAKESSCKQHSNTKGDHQEEEEEEEEEEAEEEKEKDDNNNIVVGFPWTAGSSRTYTCSFCKRKFRSAQALGGHMNVHRRDRAKLRGSSPPILLDSITSHHHHHHHDFLGSSSDQQPIKFLKLYDFSTFHGQEESDSGCKIWKKKGNKFVKKRETALLNSSNEIDLELRLGF